MITIPAISVTGFASIIAGSPRFSFVRSMVLTPDGLRVVCAGFDYDPEAIGKHMLEMLAKFRNEGIVD